MGADPATGFLKNLNILDERGYIVVNKDMETAVPGINGAGDVTVKDLRQVVTATNDGAIAANACKGLKKLTTVTGGKNVKKIGKNAFKSCGKLAKLVIKATKLTEKNVKAGAFSGLAADIEVTCPKGKADEYKTLLLARGLSATAVFK